MRLQPQHTWLRMSVGKLVFLEDSGLEMKEKGDNRTVYNLRNQTSIESLLKIVVINSCRSSCILNSPCSHSSHHCSQALAKASNALLKRLAMEHLPQSASSTIKLNALGAFEVHLLNLINHANLDILVYRSIYK